MRVTQRAKVIGWGGHKIYDRDRRIYVHARLTCHEAGALTGCINRGLWFRYLLNRLCCHWSESPLLKTVAPGNGCSVNCSIGKRNILCRLRPSTRVGAIRSTPAAHIAVRVYSCHREHTASVPCSRPSRCWPTGLVLRPPIAFRIRAWPRRSRPAQIDGALERIDGFASQPGRSVLAYDFSVL